MYTADGWLASKAKTLNFLARRFGRAPGDAAPEAGQLSRAEAMEMVVLEDSIADDCMPFNALSERVRIGVSVASLVCRAGILADVISLPREVLRGLLDASLCGDRMGMYTHLNRLWDALGLPAIEGHDTGNVLQFGWRFRQKEMGLRQS